MLLYQSFCFTLAENFKSQPDDARRPSRLAVVRPMRRPLGGSHALRADPPPADVTASENLLRFVTSSFPSIWTLELLLLLKRDRRFWSREELVGTLRASELVVSKALDSLVAAGLASIDDRGVQYMPTNDQVAAFVDETEALYAARPDAVRRAIVRGAGHGASAFSDAFRLRRDGR